MYFALNIEIIQQRSYILSFSGVYLGCSHEKCEHFEMDAKKRT